MALKESLETTPAAQKQFQLEAKILFQLRHPNLPRVTDYFSIPGQGQYLVMDYIEGEDLGVRLQKLGRALPVEQVVHYISQVADALIYLHAQHPPVIHRDIKPTNIRINTQDQAILVDFGIAKLLSEGAETMTGARAITPGYSPPEQYGMGATDARSDLYALGATVYHLLTNQQPPASVDVLAGSHPAPPVLHSLNSAIPAALSAVVEKAMRPNRSERLDSAAEFKRLLLEAAPAAPTLQAPVNAAAAALVSPQASAPPAAPQAEALQPPAVQPSGSQPAAKARRSWPRTLAKVAAGLVVVCLVLSFCSNIITRLSGKGPLAQTATAQAALTETVLGTSAPQATGQPTRTGGQSAPTASPQPGQAAQPAATRTRSSQAVSPDKILQMVETKRWENADQLQAAAFWPNPQTLAWVAANGLRLVRISDSAALLTIKNPSSAAITSAIFGPDNRTVACGFSDGKIRLWDISDSALLATLAPNNSAVTGLAYFSSSDYLASASENGSVYLWSVAGLASGKDPSLVRTANVSSAAINVLATSPRSGGLLIGSADGSLHAWNVRDGTLSQTIIGQGQAILAMLMDSQEGYLALSYADGRLGLYQVAADQTLALTGNSGAVHSLAFSPDGALLVGGDAKGRLLVWQTADGKLLGALSGHTAAVLSAAFSEDGLWLVSAAEDGTIILWGAKE